MKISRPGKLRTAQSDEVATSYSSSGHSPAVNVSTPYSPIDLQQQNNAKPPVSGSLPKTAPRLIRVETDEENVRKAGSMEVADVNLSPKPHVSPQGGVPNRKRSLSETISNYLKSSSSAESSPTLSFGHVKHPASPSAAKSTTTSGSGGKSGGSRRSSKLANALSSLLLSPKKELDITVLGLEMAGKTLFIQRLREDCEKRCGNVPSFTEATESGSTIPWVPTTVPQQYRFEFPDIRTIFTLNDFGGAFRTRKATWLHSVTNKTQCVVFIISVDEYCAYVSEQTKTGIKLVEALEALYAMMVTPFLRDDCKFFVLLNKTDLLKQRLLEKEFDDLTVFKNHPKWLLSKARLSIDEEESLIAGGNSDEKDLSVSRGSGRALCSSNSLSGINSNSPANKKLKTKDANAVLDYLKEVITKVYVESTGRNEKYLMVTSGCMVVDYYTDFHGDYNAPHVLQKFEEFVSNKG